VRPEFADHADLFQTLAEAAGASLPADRHYPGRSFLPTLTRARSIADWKQVQVGEYGDLRMARSATHKLIRRHGRGDDQLFDLVADPRETHNVIGDPAHAHVVQELDAQIERRFAPMADSPKSGLRVTELRAHNNVEAWRGERE
jgi:arylsulfatase A-like enzyme